MISISPAKRIPVRLDLAQANLASIGTLAVGSLLLILLARQEPNYLPFRWFHVFYFLVSLPVLVAVHEGVHALAGMIFGRLKPGAFKFGVFWHVLMPYCHCREAVSLPTYRLILIMPLLLTVPLFIWFLLLHPAVWTAILAAFSLSGCLGDLMILKALMGIKQNSLVLDSPDEAGCDILVKEET